MTLSDPLRIQKLRVIQVAVSRNGKSADAAIQRVIADVDMVFPGSSFESNTEMAQILAAFNAETVVDKTVTQANDPRSVQLQFRITY